MANSWFTGRPTRLAYFSAITPLLLFSFIALLAFGSSASWVGQGQRSSSTTTSLTTSSCNILAPCSSTTSTGTHTTTSSTGPNTTTSITSSSITTINGSSSQSSASQNSTSTTSASSTSQHSAKLSGGGVPLLFGLVGYEAVLVGGLPLIIDYTHGKSNSGELKSRWKW